MGHILCLESLELTDFKSVAHGLIEFRAGSSITGIYGQNGSGKSAVVESLFFMQRMVAGEPLPADTDKYIRSGKGQFSCRFTFRMKKGDTEGPSGEKITYSFTVSKTETGFGIRAEELLYGTRRIVGYDTSAEGFQNSFTTQQNLTAIRKQDKLLLGKLQAYLLLSESFKKSFIFTAENYGQLLKAFSFSPELPAVLQSIKVYVGSYFFLFKNDFSGKISSGKEFPLSFVKESNGTRLVFTLLYKYDGDKRIPRKLLPLSRNAIDTLNMVLPALVPDMKIRLREMGTELNADSEEVERIEFLSVHGDGAAIPLQYESDGIKKIVSILGVLIDMYNNPKVTVVIDELDSGIFEYLLGELTKIIEDNGMGQLIFTSHNLRPLELLDYKSLYFTTTNPDNRFTRLSSIKTNNNVRRVYYSEIQLGGRDEDLYDMVESCVIRDAFCDAGALQEAIDG